MKKVFFTIACFAWGGMASQTRTEEWTQFRGRDFMRTSERSTAPEWNSEGIAWKTPLPLVGGAVLLRSDRFLYRMKPASTAFSTHSGEGGRQAAPAFEPTWESQRQFQCPDWLRDAKLGIYAQ